MNRSEEIRVSSIPLSGTPFSEVEIRRRRDGRSIRLSNGRRSRAVGRYFSIKTGGSHLWESRPELSDLYHAEVDGWVVGFTTQPETLSWRSRGKAWRYTPDRIDILEDGSRRVVEVKADYDADEDPVYAEKLRQATEIYGLLGRTFALRDRSVILAEPLFSAVEETQAYRRAVVTGEQTAHVHHRLGRGPASLGELMTDCPGNHPRESILAMAVRRIVRIDLSQGLSRESPTSLIRGVAQ